MIIFIFSLLCSFFVNTANAAETQVSDLPHVNYFRNPYYASEGFRLGFILDFHRAGFPFWIFSYEGQMMTGFGSDRIAAIDQYCMKDEMNWIEAIKDQNKKKAAIDQANQQCFVLNNPWHFSTLQSGIYQRYLSLHDVQSTPVLVYYVSPIVALSHVITSTDNFIEGVYATNPNLNLPKSYRIPSSEIPIAERLNVDHGFVEGRVVTASLEHYIRKSFEVTIQEGPYGNNFRRMSVSDQTMFDYIVSAMLTAKMVRVEYLKITSFENSLLRIGRYYDTPYQVVGLEIESGSPPSPTRPTSTRRSYLTK
jgi:hypothetical protein